MTIEQIYKELSKIDKLTEKEDFLSKQIKEALSVKDDELLVHISEFALNDDCEKFNSEFRAWALQWLTEHIIDKFNNNKASDADAEILDDCLWKFKWIVADFGKSASTPKERIEETNEMMRQLYEHFELSLAAYHKALMLQNITMGDVREARVNFELWQGLAHDDMNDCEACEASDLTLYNYFIGNYEEALNAAEPILRGELTCSEVPHMTYAPVLFSMINLGKIEEARALLPQAISVISSEPRTISQMPLLIEAAVRLNERQMACDLANKYKDVILDDNDDIGALRLFIAMSVFDEQTYKRALEGAASFDKRDQNSYYSDYLQEYYAKFSK
ncbi:hypothetical protein [Campylobacter curvus]|uniref:Tetratricopeptide repeat protein n=1 Tax=Campylobacter curvus (strain 525.92) TaxID=360105 RepID=A7GX89_CAMC5|nr:hypothetical protein [Campylobacter curvus]EAU00016.1 hypothetical protein CCV52592_0963 [Campylobacter curvus 525.92]